MMRVLFLMLLAVYNLECSATQLSFTPRIFTIDHFLTDEECDYLINISRPYLSRSRVVNEKGGPDEIDSRRTSQGYFIPNNPKDKILKRIEERIAALTGMPKENGEAIHVLYYPLGAEYQPHFDYFDVNTPGGQTQIARGGQRVASLIMYLNTPEAGGETIFPRARISVAPKKGSAVLFYSCLPNGATDPLSFHGGAPVKGGEKWIATKWIRMGTFR